MTRVERIEGDFPASSRADCLPADGKKLAQGIALTQFCSFEAKIQNISQ